MSVRKDSQSPRPKSTRFDDLPVGPIVPFDPSWDAGPRAQRTELQITTMTEDSADAGPSILVAPFNPSDAAALQRRLTNRWEEGLDLAGADLRRRDLSDFEEELVRCNMQGADLSGARLTETQLPYANLRGANLSGVAGVITDFTGADLREANLSRANLTMAKMGGAIMAGANMEEATLVSTRMPGANLRGANLRSADLTGADLRGADLTGADLYRACLYETDFAGAIMPNGARFKSPDDDESEEIAMLYSRP